MILYSIVPAERVFDPPGGGPARLVTATVGGVRLLVRPDGAGRGEIVRLLSTDPEAYFDPRWQPGRRVRLP